MRKKDFEFECNASGYDLYYKHRPIGGYRIKGRPRAGAAGKRAKDRHKEMAEAEIAALLDERGMVFFVQNIMAIEDEYASIQKYVQEE